MAGRADAAGVAVSDWERRVLRVIERCTRPGGGVVAVLASRREKLRLRRVARVGGVVVVSLMAPDAGRGQRRVVVVYMAIAAYAWRHRMGSG